MTIKHIGPYYLIGHELDTATGNTRFLVQNMWTRNIFEIPEQYVDRFYEQEETPPWIIAGVYPQPPNRLQKIKQKLRKIFYILKN